MGLQLCHPFLPLQDSGFIIWSAQVGSQCIQSLTGIAAIDKGIQRALPKYIQIGRIRMTLVSISRTIVVSIFTGTKLVDLVLINPQQLPGIGQLLLNSRLPFNQEQEQNHRYKQQYSIKPFKAKVDDERNDQDLSNKKPQTGK
ncbi:hypothetical protein D3C86_1635970 [compost metagenome]